jgi:DcaP outer membrane protein
MTITRTFTRAALAALLLAGGRASAETQETEELRAELKKLREEVEALKGKAEEAEVKAKDAVVLGDIPGSFRVPGTDLSIKIYGFAELNWVHDFRADNSDIDYSTFAPYLPLKGTLAHERTNRDYLTGRTSRFGVEAATPTRFGVLSAKIEGDFNNEPRLGNTAQYVNGSGGSRALATQQQTSSYGFRIRHAYGSFGGLLAGMTWSTFMDVDNSPETLDFNGPIGATFIRQPQIRYTYFTPGWGNFSVALENSSSYVLNTSEAAAPGSLSRMPDLVARWDRGFDWGSMSARAVTDEIRVHGIVEEPSADNPEPASVRGTRRGWGVGSTAFVKARGGADYLSVALTYGDGIGRYLNYIEGAFYDPQTNWIRLERAVGVVAGYQLKWSDRLRVNMVYGMTRNFDNAYTAAIRANGLATPGDRFGINRQVQQAHLGPIFTPMKGVDLGVEGMWAQRKTLAGETGDMLRLNFSAKYYIN